MNRKRTVEVVCGVACILLGSRFLWSTIADAQSLSSVSLTAQLSTVLWGLWGTSGIVVGLGLAGGFTSEKQYGRYDRLVRTVLVGGLFCLCAVFALEAVR
ncbi:hypothetical protein AUR64_15420 [Haloprofundus marisrubri]|uniref:Uncharacterized protein n=1 Tax=Haloprofundus marisrubri TaxID=1514971 RepID=A0A0W1R6X7_9EURY|nr:hypothetical protein [Haloprofundus marisrubri]KTG09182.1 hypothetical protein AUR64_15420 [Haloprofundus marisrubri]